MFGHVGRQQSDREASDPQAAVRVCAGHEIPFVARGAGTGLSGGAVPVAEGVVIGLARMNAILEVDVASRRARVQPGVANLEISRAVAGHGLYFAPDPSSQQSCTVGGNVANNSGGPHCLLYGVTSAHVLATNGGAQIVQQGHTRTLPGAAPGDDQPSDSSIIWSSPPAR